MHQRITLLELDGYLGMTKDQHRLLRHIWIVIILKLMVLFAIWWFFMRDHRVEADGQRTAEHFSTPVIQSNSIKEEGASP